MDVEKIWTLVLDFLIKYSYGRISGYDTLDPEMPNSRCEDTNDASI